MTNQVLAARLDALRFDLTGQMAELRADLATEMAGVHGEMGDLRTEMSGLRAEMARGFQVQTWRLVGTMFVAFGLFATLARFG